MICCTLLRGVIRTSAGVLSISTRFQILVALAKSSRVSLKSSLLSITAPAAWPRGVPAEREERPFSASCNSVVRSVSNRQTNLSWHFGPVLVSAAWICQRGPSRCLEHHDALYSDTSAIWGEKGSTSEGIVFQHSWKVMECNSFRNVHLWVYNKRVSVCVFSPLTFRSKVA